MHDESFCFVRFGGLMGADDQHSTGTTSFARMGEGRASDSAAKKSVWHAPTMRGLDLMSTRGTNTVNPPVDGPVES